MLNAKAVSLSFAITTVILYLLCSLFVYISSQGFSAFLNTWVHGLDLTMIVSLRPFTFTSFIIGFVSIFIASLAFGYVFSAIYNALSRTAKY